MWKPGKPPHHKYKEKQHTDLLETSKFIFQIGEYDELRKPSIVVRNFGSEDLSKKIDYIKKSLLKYRNVTGFGRGISAVQVGIPEQISVIYTPERLVTLINPKIIHSSTIKLKYPEMCMSASPLIASVIRSEWVEVEYYDEKGNKNTWRDKDRILNRVVQHEIDHLAGVINIDRVDAKTITFALDPEFYSSAQFEEI